MATIKRFEELGIWQDARLLCKKICVISIDTGLCKDYPLKNQILGSSGSVMDNIAKGLSGETRSQNYRTWDADHINEQKYNELLNDCLNLSAIISHLIQYLRNSTYDGLKKAQL